MSMEKSLWTWMRDNSRTMNRLDLQRVENRVSRGMPDVNGFYTYEFWVELKGALRPVRSTSKLRFELSDFQVRWMQKRWIMGGLAWLYMRVGTGSRISRYIICPGEPGHLERMQSGVTEADVAAMSLLPPDHTFQEAIYRFAHRMDYPLI